MTDILDYMEARSPQGAEFVGWVELFAKPIMRPQIAA
jgi:hypothetical protein